MEYCYEIAEICLWISKVWAGSRGGCLTKGVSWKPLMNNDLNLDELHNYPRIISMNWCKQIFDIVEDQFSRIFIPCKVEDLIPIVFNMVTGINESNILIKQISCECRCEFGARKSNPRQKWIKCQWECKKPLRHCPCEEDYARNPGTCACECRIVRLANT